MRHKTRLLKCVSAANRDGEGYIGLDTKKRLSGSLVRTFRQSLYLVVCICRLTYVSWVTETKRSDSSAIWCACCWRHKHTCIAFKAF